MQGLAATLSNAKAQEAALLLGVRYLREVVTAAGPDADAVRGAAAEALARCEAELKALGGVGGTGSSRGGRQL
jgi:hypothetical protein